MINKLIDKLKQANDIILGDDGFYCYWPEKSDGFLTSADLRGIANYLDEINEPWRKNIDEYFSKQKNLEEFD
jgi:hypothetical protein